jgi:hypothetical protein
MTALMTPAQRHPSAQQQQRQSHTAKMVHIAIVATAKFSDLAVNLSRRSAGTTRKCANGCDFYCPKRNEKTNKNLHPLLPRSKPNNNNNSTLSINTSMGSTSMGSTNMGRMGSVAVIPIPVKELHQHRHQPPLMLGLVNQSQGP